MRLILEENVKLRVFLVKWWLLERERRACSQPTNSEGVQGCRDTSLHGKIRNLLSGMKFKQWEVVENLEVENLRWILRVWRESSPLKKIFGNEHSVCCFSYDVLKKKLLNELFTSFYLHEGRQNTPPSVRVAACLPGWLEGSCPWHLRLLKAWHGAAGKGKLLFPPFHEFQHGLCLYLHFKILCITCTPVASVAFQAHWWLSWPELLCNR